MKLQIADLEFEPLIAPDAIQKRIVQVAQQINEDFKDQKPLFVGILNGSFMFIADLVKEIVVPCDITFTKLASYFGGVSSSRKIRDDFDLSVSIEGRDIILVEDIIDTGNTIKYLVEKLTVRNPASITICSLLLKPDSLEDSIEELRYVAFQIPNDFVVGYGLDYKELGRNLKGIYKKV
ncbi:hypoxanthine phosphoribosyltransferase [Mucilaginibacter segetis]|uniref:Hypoxanthine phosphoribosyltransferase n=1 Tax=Mucilaginibacter segetis TaxID=2793071 RepID=A0A934PVQ5_9SPHI|nr:hypoxanthine phosphoribosyltransferase [Mucilaginibacter segetis]MBK0379961.1 hypoxanthine phosphoribosyltransferase [Mucilaginibacter segetis]